MNESAIKDALQAWLEQSLGAAHVFTITFDVDFVAGNLINGTFEGDAITQVAFTGNHADTLELLRAAIQATTNIFTARITGARQITCRGTPNGTEITVLGPTVTGGLAQAVATIADVTEPVFVQVIDAEQNSKADDADPERTAPRPPYPYATLQVDTVLQHSWDETRRTDAEGITSMGGQRRATVSVNYYGDDPMDQIAAAISAMDKETVTDLFRAAGISVWQKNPGQNLTGLLETRNEPRASFDFFIGFAENYEDDTGLIETVEDLTGQVDGETVGPITVEVDP